ncbi:MAG: alpha/beta hydrolase [Alphaproteobacteria bacterium]|nr:alpha/beta hydrolase [Alphaproteobacteria bacterium]
MSIATLSGWGQPHDALTKLLPGSHAIDYAASESVEAALAIIGREARGHDALVGWSLGGQLAARAVAEKIIQPKKLVLIAAPYQFVQSPASKLGMPRLTFDQFTSNFSSNPLRTLTKAWDLVGYEDVFSDAIRSQLAAFSKHAVLANNWLSWLSLLDGYSCDALDFDHFPPTLLLHGEADVVVDASQSARFAERLPQATLSLWPGCGHAPHWHDTTRFKQLITEHLNA